jgi:hypothetical protein
MFGTEELVDTSQLLTCVPALARETVEAARGDALADPKLDKMTPSGAELLVDRKL